jgi:hypothetical protein
MENNWVTILGWVARKCLPEEAVLKSEIKSQGDGGCIYLYRSVHSQYTDPRRNKPGMFDGCRVVQNEMNAGIRSHGLCVIWTKSEAGVCC